MTNIVILINPTEYPYHTAVNNKIISCLRAENHTISTFDIASETHDYQCLDKIKTSKPDILVTLDLAGFHFRTQAGENALNMLPTKNLNLIWGDKAEYAPLLNKKLSLSMLFYDVSGTDNCLPDKYNNLLYYKVFDSIECFPQIWSHFLEKTCQNQLI